jgi:flavin reductase (DIM6/NTAB) family NADH-FMN oxidoreductase RutF
VTQAAVIDAGTLRQAFSHFPSGVTAICALVDGNPVGLAASSFTSLSLDPPQALACVARNSATWGLLRRAKRLGVSVLGESHAQTCRRLAGPADERFAGTDWSHTMTGAVRIEGAPLFLECEVAHVVPGGDHFIVVLNIGEVESNHDVSPIVFHRSTFYGLGCPIYDTGR